MTATILHFVRMAKPSEPPPNRIREWRVKRDMTQEEMAEALGAKQNYVSRIENGDTGITLDRLHAVARVLRVDVGQLLARKDNQFGLDEEAVELLSQVQENPQLTQPLLQMAKTIMSYKPEPEPEPEQRQEPERRVADFKRRGPHRG